MKLKLFFTILCVWWFGMPYYGSAQEDDYISDSTAIRTSKKTEYPTNAFGISVGINNPAGMLGFETQFFPGNQVALMLGAGLSTWGYKLSAGIGACRKPKGFYYRISANYATGGVLYDMEVKTTRDTTVKMDLYLSDVWATTVNLGYSWKVGKKNIFYIGAGYTLLLARDPYKLIKEKDPYYDIDPDFRKALIILAPGGISLQMGFLIGF